MANIKDVAKKANVSISTVSCYINGTKSISAPLKLKIQSAIDELQFETNTVARTLKSRKSGIIGVILPKITSVFFPQVLNGIEETAAENGYSIMYFDSSQNPQKEMKYVRLLKQYWVEGIILDSSANRTQDTDYIEFLSNVIVQDNRIPIVSLESFLDDKLISTIGIDNEYGGYLATQHLLQIGRRRIAHITGHHSFQMTHDRIKGYQRALKEWGLDYNHKMVCNGDFSPISGFNALIKLIKSGEKPDALFASNDQEAIGAIKAIKEHGLTIPDDIAVIGFDNVPIASLIDPSLSTINFSKYSLGQVAAKTLIEKIRNGSFFPKHQLLEINLVVRKSTDVNCMTQWDLSGW